MTLLRYSRPQTAANALAWLLVVWSSTHPTLLVVDALCCLCPLAQGFNCFPHEEKVDIWIDETRQCADLVNELFFFSEGTAQCNQQRAPWKDACCLSQAEEPFNPLEPSASPSANPTVSSRPSGSPTFVPSASPSSSPTASPSATPSLRPSTSPSDVPSRSPTNVPSLQPSQPPSDVPSASPSTIPSEVPTVSPTTSLQPSASPSSTPTSTPTDVPSTKPSLQPTMSSAPSSAPTTSLAPTQTAKPTEAPTETQNSNNNTTNQLEDNEVTPSASSSIGGGVIAAGAGGGFLIIVLIGLFTYHQGRKSRDPSRNLQALETGDDDDDFESDVMLPITPSKEDILADLEVLSNEPPPFATTTTPTRLTRKPSTSSSSSAKQRSHPPLSASDGGSIRDWQQNSVQALVRNSSFPAAARTPSPMSRSRSGHHRPRSYHIGRGGVYEANDPNQTYADDVNVEVTYDL